MAALYSTARKLITKQTKGNAELALSTDDFFKYNLLQTRESSLPNQLLKQLFLIAIYLVCNIKDRKYLEYISDELTYPSFIFVFCCKTIQ